MTDDAFEANFGKLATWEHLATGGENEVFLAADGIHVIKRLASVSDGEFDLNISSDDSANSANSRDPEISRLNTVRKEFRLPRRHDNITTTIAVSPSYTAELRRDGTLVEHVSSHDRPSLKERLRVCNNVLSGVVAIHETGIAHLDIKPDNILMSNRVASVADFGFATCVDESDLGIGGTAGWTPSHRWSGKKLFLVDVYSACMIVIGILAWSKDLFDECTHFHRLIDRETRDVASYCDVLKTVFSDTCFFPSGNHFLPQTFLEELQRGLLGVECGEEDGSIYRILTAVMSLEDSL